MAATLSHCFRTTGIIMAQTPPSPAAPIALQREQPSKFGTQITKSGVRFRVWAPQCETVKLAIDERSELLELRALPRGWHELEVDGLGAGTQYQFVLPDGQRVPDSASRHQPRDVDGPSEVIDPRAFPWTDRGWGGRPWEEAVVYELHVGTFTEEGTFRAVIDCLDYLSDLGVTALELMPIADFRGRWSWGYDGVLQFAPASAYGRPDDLKALIDAAHARAMMVFLDVVYNHFGPEGNFMSMYMPLNSEGHESTWGKGLNFDDDPPDPNSEEAFRSSKLDWVALEDEHNADHRGLYKKLLEIRRQEIVPRLKEMGDNTGHYEIVAGHALRVRWTLAGGTTLHLLANLHSEPLEGVDLWGSRHLWLEGYADAHTLQGWGVIWSLEERSPEESK
jgi:1,4-alpha-glucan branching enzyme